MIPSAEASPRPFGKYLLDREIARGGMARVHLARLRGLGGFEKRLVVKQILPHLASDPRFVSMFVEEAKTLVQLSHPHVVPVYELGVVDGVYFLAMEYVEGATLADVLEEGALTPAEVAHVGAQLCDALCYAHERFGIVHRDVTPRNVIVDGAGHARLLDFGIAAPASDGPAPGLFGTPGYLSPEQARGEAVGAASDVFSLGALLAHALLGTPAFDPRDLEQVRELRQDRRARPLAERGAPDRDLAAILDRALEPDPDARPDARTFGRALRGWLAPRHPEGVAPELGARAERARQRRERARADGQGPDAPEPIAAPRGAPRTEPARPGAQTLAQRRDLEALLGGPAPVEHDERVPEAAREPSNHPARTQTVPLPGRSGHEPRAARDASPRESFGEPLAVLGIGAAIAVLAVAALSLRPGTHHTRTAPATSAPRPAAEASPLARAYLTARPDATLAPSPSAVDEAREVLAVPARDPRPRDSATDPDGPATEPTRSGRATLAVTVAHGWATVTLDGRTLGTTPIRRARIASGSHTIVARNEALGREARTRFEIEPGRHLHVLVDLDADPPRVTFADR